MNLRILRTKLCRECGQTSRSEEDACLIVLSLTLRTFSLVAKFADLGVVLAICSSLKCLHFSRKDLPAPSIHQECCELPCRNFHSAVLLKGFTGLHLTK